jgi:murein L,D-transpeptidase YcbB/YkuD
MVVSCRSLSLTGCLVGSLLILCHPLTAAATSTSAAPSDEIRARVEKIESGSGLSVKGASVTSTTVLPALYRQSDFTPVWNNPRSVAQLFHAVRSIDEDGLDPADYHLAALEALQAEIGAGANPNPAQTANMDVLLTDSLIRLSYHLLIGKVDPVELDSNWNLDRTINGRDAVQALSSAIAEGTIQDLLASVRPQHRYYRRLQEALARYRAIAAIGGWPSVPPGAALKPGVSDERVLALRQRLAVTHIPSAEARSPLFDAELEDAVRQFQRQHGLVEDGVVGKATLGALNVPVDARIDQIRVNLERARWVLHEMPREYVLVDIAGFRVSYFRDGQSLWQARAQVGKPYRKTPVFRSQITYIEMNPTWTVPPTILREDVLPAIQRDIDYLKEKNMRVIDYHHKVLDPASIDWLRYKGPDFPYLIRQGPGPTNALGRIKFMFPNKHLVYLHDTPSKALFERTERAFSSGCIRVENPFEFAELLLDDPRNWSRRSIIAAIDSLQTRRVTLPRPVTVLLLYWTVAPGEQGEALFKQDIYDRDAAVLAGLNSEPSFYAPVFTWADDPDDS